MSKAGRDPLALKFKGSNKAFAPFSALGDGEALTALWKVAAAVRTQLDEGDRVSNLAWRLWHIHGQTVIDQSLKHRREFKKLAKGVGERLDRDRGRPLEELGVPDVPEQMDASGRLGDRVMLKDRTRRQSRNGTAQSMMHTFELDPTVGVPKTGRSGSNASVGSNGGRPSFPGGDQQQQLGGPRPPTVGRDVDMTSFDLRPNASTSSGMSSAFASSSNVPATSLQRASSIPSALRMTPNSSRRSSFVRPVDESENLPPPYPSNHPFARQHAAPNQMAPISGLPHDAYNAQLGLMQAQGSAFNLQQPQQQQQPPFPLAAAQSLLASLPQGQQASLENLHDPAQAQQVVTATLNQLWSQLGCDAGGQQNVDMLSTCGPSPPVMPNSTPASSSDVSSPDNSISPSAPAGSTLPAQFHFAQRVTGLQGPAMNALSTAGTGGMMGASGAGMGGGTAGGSSWAGSQPTPYRRPSVSDGLNAAGQQGAPYRRPSLSQQSSTLASAAGSPSAGVGSPFAARTGLHNVDTGNLIRRGSLAKRRRESMNHTVGGSNDPPAGAQLASSSTLTPNWSTAGTPSGDLASGFLGVEISSPIDDVNARLLRLNASTATSPKPPHSKGRSYSNNSGYSRPGLQHNLSSSSSAVVNFSAAGGKPLMKGLNAAHLSTLSHEPQGGATPQWQDPSSSSVFLDDVPMEDSQQQPQHQHHHHQQQQEEKNRRRASESTMPNRSNSLRDQLREMQLQHQSYQQAANYAATLDAYVPPTPSSGNSQLHSTQQTQQRPSPLGLGSVHSPSAQSPGASLHSNSNDVFPSLSTPLMPSSSNAPPPSTAALLNAHASQAHNPYLEQPDSFNPSVPFDASADFSFAPAPNLDDIGSLFNEFLAGGADSSGLPSGGSSLKPVTESDHDS